MRLDSEGEETVNDKPSEGVRPVIDLPDSDEEDLETLDLAYLVGDVTSPQNTADNDAIIVHCVGKFSLVVHVYSKNIFVICRLQRQQ